MGLDLPRGEYHFGPLTIRANIIEPFIIPHVYVCIGYDMSYELKFDDDYQRAEFVHMLDYFRDCPYSYDDIKELRDRISDRADRDEIERRKEYPQSRLTKAEVIAKDAKEQEPKKRWSWWPF